MAGKSPHYSIPPESFEAVIFDLEELITDTAAVELLHRIKKHGMKTAAISSGKNSALLLDAADLANLFDVRVDGVDAEALGIPGEPAPHRLLEAARQLCTKPERMAVIAGTVPGIQAGRTGKFGLVIGIARTAEKDSLRKSGAHAVVADLSAVSVAADPEKEDALPCALEHFAEISRRLAGKHPAVFLDYDGTLTPIVETPEQAILHEDMRKALTRLSRHCPVGIISGRVLRDVRDKVRIDAITYAGSHGFDIIDAKGEPLNVGVGEEFLPILDRAQKDLSGELAMIPGILVERKKFSIAVHYRLVDPGKMGTVERGVDDVMARHPRLRKAYGKKVFELQPDIEWDKGRALLVLLDMLKLDREDVFPFYIGDDVTDEDAFRALRDRGAGIVVREKTGDTAAAYSLKHPGEVRQFLLKLISLCESGKR